MKTRSPSRNLLRVDLSRGVLQPEPLDPDLSRQFLGGSGLSAALIGQQDVGAIGPLSPGIPSSG